MTKRLFFFSDLITVKGVLGMEGFGAGEEEEYSLSVLIVLTSFRRALLGTFMQHFKAIWKNIFSC